MPPNLTVTVPVLLAVAIVLLSIFVFRKGSKKPEKPRSTALTIRISHILGFAQIDKFLDMVHTLTGGGSQEGERVRNILLWSYAPSAISADSEKEYVATVTFREVPPVLRVGGVINLTDAYQSLSVVVDTHFFGLTPLSNPTGGATVDIIAVTGLAGHAFGSWKSHNAATMWLRDFLPEHVPTARILTYGYDSALLGSASNASIYDFAMRFLQALKAARSHEEEKYRPIIFIGHSLGGLVIKQALARAAKGNEKDKQIFLSCYGILFFGVPNRGLNITALKSMVKGQPNSRLISDLDPGSPSLKVLHEMFADQFKFKDSPIVSIFETKWTKTVVETRKGVWERVGPAVLMVPESSATYALPTENSYDQFSIDADHSAIVKFSDSADPDYLSVRQKIIDFVKEAPVAIEKRRRGQSSSGENPPSHVVQLRARMKTFLNPVDFEADTTYRAWNHCEGTGDWLFSDPDFQEWRDMLLNEILWLNGNPGCGKTYLMSKILEHIKDHHKTKAAVIYFFCDNKTASQQNTIPSIAKTLLSQLLELILSSRPVDAETCVDQFEKFAGDDKMIPWLFQDTLKRIGSYIPKVFLILDAVDECDDPHGLLTLLKNIGNIPTTAFHIILASRQSIRRSLFRIHEGRVCGIQVSQEKVRRDVDTFIRNKVQLLDISDLGGDDEAATRLINGCDSLFLLAHLRLESLRRRKFYTLHDLDEALSSLPEDLTKFYDETLKILKEMSHSRIDLARRIFLWVIYAKRRLSFKELAQAVSVPLADSDDDTYPPIDPRNTLTQVGFDNLCGGLLVFKYQHDSDSSELLVELVHSTVKDYIMNFVWQTTPLRPSLQDQNESNAEIALLAISYISRLDGQKFDLNSHFLLEYVYRFWILHLLDTKTPTEPLLRILPEFLNSENCLLWWDSPLSAPLNKKISDRRYLQARFHGWITVNVAKDHPELQPHTDFIITQQEKQLAYRTEINGKTDVRTAESMFNLASMYADRGRLTEAEELQMQVLAIRKRALGEDHLETQKAISNLAATYGNQGRWKDAENLMLQVIDTFKRTLGKDHPDSSTATGNLVTIYRGQGRLREARILGTEVLATCKRVLGDEHPDTLAAMGNLVATYGEQGSFDLAEEMGLELMATCKRVLGDDHPDTLSTIRSLAATYGNQGRWKEAEDLQVQMLASMERVLGQEHTETLAVMGDLATSYRRQRRWKWKQEADLNLRILSINTDVFGEDHQNTRIAKMNLASTYESTGRKQESEQLESQILASTSKVLGGDHPETLAAMERLLLTSNGSGNFSRVWRLPLGEDLLARCKRQFGEHHPNTIVAMFHLSETYFLRGRLEARDNLRSQAISVSQQTLGDNNPVTMALKEHDKVWSHNRRTDEDNQSENIDPENQPQTLESLANLATGHWRQRQTKEAEYLVAQIIAAIKIGFVEESHLEMMRALSYLDPIPEDKDQTQWREIEILREGILSLHLGDRNFEELAGLALAYRNQGLLYR